MRKKQELDSQSKNFDALDWTSLIGIDESERGFIGGGAFGDVYRGRWIDMPAGLEVPEVALKVMRVVTVDAEIAQARFRVNSLSYWSNYIHLN